MFSDHNGIKYLKQNSMPMYTPLIKEGIKSEIRKYFELKENKNTTCQVLYKWNSYIRKYTVLNQWPQFHLKKLERS